jgi:hypothetical protein
MAAPRVFTGGWRGWKVLVARSVLTMVVGLTGSRHEAGAPIRGRSEVSPRRKTASRLTTPPTTGGRRRTSRPPRAPPLSHHPVGQRTPLISERAALVTGDGDLLTIDADLPIYSRVAFIDLIGEP